MDIQATEDSRVGIEDSNEYVLFETNPYPTNSQRFSFCPACLNNPLATRFSFIFPIFSVFLVHFLPWTSFVPRFPRSTLLLFLFFLVHAALF